MKHLTITIDIEYTDEAALRQNYRNLLEFVDITEAVYAAINGKGVDPDPLPGDVTDKADGSVYFTVASRVTQ